MSLARCEEMAAQLGPGAVVKKSLDEDGDWSHVEFDHIRVSPIPGGYWDLWPEHGGEHPLELGLSFDEVIDYFTDAEFERAAEVTMVYILSLIDQCQELHKAYGHQAIDKSGSSEMKKVIGLLQAIQNEAMLRNPDFIPTEWEVLGG